MTHSVLFSFEFDGRGGGTPLKGDSISQTIEDDKLAWVHFDGNKAETAPWLENELSYLDPFIVKALLDEETRPRMTAIKDGILLILRGVNLNENAAPEDMVSIRLWIDNHRIISVTRRNVKALNDIAQMIENKTGPKDAGDFLTLICARLFERMEPILRELDDTTDEIEELILEDADISLRQSIIETRKKAIMFRRYMMPQRDAIDQLRMSQITWLNETHKRHLQESYNHVTRYVEDLDSVRERAQIVKDELANMLADRLNKNMYILSVIAAIFLPLGFLTGLLGINVGGIPGTEDPNAFTITCSLMLILIVAQVIIFKKLKWF